MGNDKLQCASVVEVMSGCAGALVGAATVAGKEIGVSVRGMMVKERIEGGQSRKNEENGKNEKGGDIRLLSGTSDVEQM